jgi:hypothetical protein
MAGIGDSAVIEFQRIVEAMKEDYGFPPTWIEVNSVSSYA